MEKTEICNVNFLKHETRTWPSFLSHLRIFSEFTACPPNRSKSHIILCCQLLQKQYFIKQAFSPNIARYIGTLCTTFFSTVCLEVSNLNSFCQFALYEFLPRFLIALTY